MKKLIFMLSAVIFLFTACQKEEAKIKPDTDSGVYKETTLEDFCVATKLIAGGGTHDADCDGLWVGNVYVEEEGTTVRVQYVIDGEDGDDWWIDQVHLYVGDVDGIPLTNQGNPIPGQFPINVTFDLRVQIATHEVKFPDGIPTNYVVAAHAVVVDDEYLPTEGQSICDVLPETVTVYTHNNLHKTSYLKAYISNGGWLNGVYDAWCIDEEHPFPSFEDYHNCLVYCTYPLDNPPPYTDADHLVFEPQNWDLVNWLINQDFIGNPSSENCGEELYIPLDVQHAIWFLLDDHDPAPTCRSLELEQLARDNGEGFIPECGDKILVAIDPDIEGVTDVQKIAISIDYPCGTANDETAWGYGYCDGCDGVGVCHDGEDEEDVAIGDSFINEFGAKKWGWFFYGCNYTPPED